MLPFKFKKLFSFYLDFISNIYMKFVSSSYFCSQKAHIRPTESRTWPHKGKTLPTCRTRAFLK